ncbi:D-amino-acid oxidase-like protein [Amniculicola lignicola CBS 123094]|uniref:D-amino-acid oxidase-like protein n=1 Tax=Amniculicola lignicola CBS 123094 TaxID=1392246 RepID=A0A6A5WLU4_9PLEO|nr:D-amino-acid oxidase-like protein [Amniculicola lignicola CBS 123094]
MSSQPPTFLVLGAGVIGLTSALSLRDQYPSSPITILATHFPGDRSINYTSPWAGANWCSFAHDNGPLESYDRTTFHKFSEIVDKYPEAGIRRMPIWAVFEARLEETGILTEETGKVWYEELAGLRDLTEEEVASCGGLEEGVEGFGWAYEKAFTVNTQVYLNWLQNRALSKGINTVRRTYPSIKAALLDFPSTTLLVNATGLGSLTLEDVKDTTMYPTRGQTVLVSEPKVPIPRMYIRSPGRLDPTTTYVFPRPFGGGVILGGSRQEGDWSAEPDMQLAKEIMERCCKLCPALGRPEDLQIVSHNVGLRPSRKEGTRVEREKKSEWGGVSVVHCYGHSGAGYQSSWGSAERVVELVGKALEAGVKL